tara:strand:+ start:1305 stop:2459 length:1155 start_codon:yes stop_codon:yes gene_type:complete
MANKRIIKEEVDKMLNLIEYDRGKITFIQSNNLLQEKDITDYKDQKSTKEKEDEKLWQNADTAWVATELAATGGLYAAGGTAIVGSGGLLLIPLAVGGVVYGLWKWGESAFGDKSISRQMKWSLDRNSWVNVEDTINKQSKAIGTDLWPLFKLISQSQAKNYADDFYTSFNDPDWFSNTDEDEVKLIMGRCESFLDLSRISQEYGKRDGETLEYELDDEFSVGDYKEYVSDPMFGKPITIFNGIKCYSVKELTDQITKLVLKKQEKIAGKAGLTIGQARGQEPVTNEQIDSKNDSNFKRTGCTIKDILSGCLVRSGEGGETVETLQQLLQKAGIPLEKHGADGKFGIETRNGIVEFQKQNKLDGDGIVGPATMKELIKYKQIQS